MATWKPLSSTDAPTARWAHTSVWTGSRWIVWGGYAGNTIKGLADGASYDPSNDRWTAISADGAPSPRALHAAVWIGTHMLVWGGNSDGERNDGGLFDPVTNTWTLLEGGSPYEGTPTGSFDGAVWTGREVLAYWNYFAARYDLDDRRWRELSKDGRPEFRREHAFAWTGTELIVWGGSAPRGSKRFGNGALYDPATDRWRPMSAENAPSKRSSTHFAWTGSRLIVWGGDGGSYRADGGIYDPARDRWTPIKRAKVGPSGRAFGSSALVGNTFVIWGGSVIENKQSDVTGTGGMLDLDSATWSSLPVDAAPSERTWASCASTGSEVLIWGGKRREPRRVGKEVYLTDGGRLSL